MAGGMPHCPEPRVTPRAAIAAALALTLSAPVAWALLRAPDHGRLQPVGEYTSPRGDRVAAYVQPDTLCGDCALDDLDGLTAPPGRRLLAVVYRGPAAAGDVGGRLAAAPNLARALALVGAPPFDRYAYRLDVTEGGARRLDALGR